MSENPEPHLIIGYMCRTDWDYEIDGASGGTKVYASLEDLKRHRKCVRGCGIVEVEVRLKRVVEEGTDPS